jgi:alkanesulfonate monooxygenase SsuD/methylene tetrahydromethanopterin reductase-like flavin-dependent oxidoreductase (luciferase family)
MMVADSPEASRALRDGVAAGLGMPVETVARAPMVLIGTPDEIVAELKRRATAWEVREVVIQLQPEAVVERFARDVIPALRD